MEKDISMEREQTLSTLLPVDLTIGPTIKLILTYRLQLNSVIQEPMRSCCQKINSFQMVKKIWKAFVPLSIISGLGCVTSSKIVIMVILSF